ncbi:S26 family signal peptidase [Sinorhizobium sp. 8-89]|uniref:S26 family signal peptidase n=1 Tax=Sinorhizobium sp. 7-81 TaxID=3049087 RepID=UPI0024C30E07|nr:S26 family signal peptidase [Sinorhizobium sp. 7-81]MDK1389717.1 S26 family signal peptidase [Sinorhizobium sp. 7-81]
MTRFGYFITTHLATTAILLTSGFPIPLKLVWNASASAPIGLYVIEAPEQLKVADLVAVSAPESLATFLSDRGYLPRGVPLIKHVAALPKQQVCRFGRMIIVDGALIGAALNRDRLGRNLPVWQGCRLIADDELFLMNWQVQDSLDGRYFGPIPASLVLGRAVPLWTSKGGFSEH